jgi:hypothetical protein
MVEDDRKLPVPSFQKPFTILLVALLAAAVMASPALSSPVDQFVSRAKDLQLHEERDWEVLLHYTKTLSGGYRSRIDDERFFLSPKGRTDGKAELEATLRSFFIPAPKDGEHTACRFPARYEWLRTRLGINDSQFPRFSCTERDKALGSVEATSAVLVFPVGHINSPASMFGHTLLRIDGSSRSNLISYAVNYSADTTDTNGFIYAWKGLTGKYRGYYSMMPYYIKVKEYNDLEHRDMWEYKLKLSAAEVGRMLNHIWELQNIHSSYYFLDENCSYNLLFLIEAARPELHLTDKTGVFVLPTQTIQIVMASGIIEGVNYRPSQGTKIRKIAALLDRDGQKAAHDLATSAAPPESIRVAAMADSEKMIILDLAAEYTQFRFARKELDKDAYAKLYLAILSERSMLGTPLHDPYDMDEPQRPETGHDTTKIALGGGARRGEGFIGVNIRPEFHGLLDPDQGYLRGAQIKFLDTWLRYNIPSEKSQLKTLHIVDILSIAPRDMFFSPVSWKVSTGFDTEAMANGRDYLIYRLNTGGGVSSASPFGGIVYGLGELDLNAGEKIRGKATIGPGLCIGAVEQITDRWKAHLSARGVWYLLGDDRYSLKGSLAQNVRLSRNNSLDLEYSEEFVNRHRISEVSMFWNYYF